MGQAPGDIVAHCVAAFVLPQQAEQEIVIAQHRQRRFVDERDVGEFEMRLQRVMGQHRRLDHGGKAHRRIKFAGLLRVPGAARLRRVARMREFGGVALFRLQQAAKGLVVAGNVGMDVDGAGHHDLAGNVMGFVGLATGRRLGNAAVADEKITDSVAAMSRIDDATAFEPDQHGGASGNAAAISVTASATEILPAGLLACTAARVPVAGQ